MERKAIDNRVIYALCGAGWLAITAHMILVPAPPYRPQSTAEEISRFAIATLGRVQARSISENEEFCGVIIESDDGTLSSSKVYDGGRAECSFDRFSQPGSHVIASFHTHGGVDPDYDSEFPSIEDLEGDMDDRIAGFIATPGGRIWRTDWTSGTARQLCDAGCIQQDPSYKATAEERPEPSYTLAQLVQRGGEGDQTL